MWRCYANIRERELYRLTDDCVVIYEADMRFGCSRSSQLSVLCWAGLMSHIFYMARCVNELLVADNELRFRAQSSEYILITWIVVFALIFADDCLPDTFGFHEGNILFLFLSVVIRFDVIVDSHYSDVFPPCGPNFNYLVDGEKIWFVALLPPYQFMRQLLVKKSFHESLIKIEWSEISLSKTCP